MYAKYVWNAGSNLDQMLDDVCKLLTGTAIASLSASCDKVNSEMYAQSAENNWTVFDVLAGTGGQVLRSLNTDGTSYKYLHLYYASSVLRASIYESWNATTHVGLNIGIYAPLQSVAGWPTVFATTGGTVYLYATKNTLLITSATGGISVLEFSRDSATLDSSYPCHVLAVFNPSSATPIPGCGAGTANGTLVGVALCRVKYAAAVGDLKASSTPAVTAYCHGIQPIGVDYGTYVFNNESSGYSIDAVPIIDPTTNTTSLTALSMLVYSSLGVAFTGSALGKVVEGKIISKFNGGLANHLDEIVVDGVTHIMIATSSGHGTMMVFPKG